MYLLCYSHLCIYYVTPFLSSTFQNTLLPLSQVSPYLVVKFCCHIQLTYKFSLRPFKASRFLRVFHSSSRMCVVSNRALQGTAAPINVSGVSHSLRRVFQILNRLLGFAETYYGRS